MDEVSDWEAEGGLPLSPRWAPPAGPEGNGPESMTVTVSDKSAPADPDYSEQTSWCEFLGNYDVSRTWVNGEERWFLVKIEEFK